MTSRYVVGGLTFSADRALPRLPESGFADLEIVAEFTSGIRSGANLFGPDGTSATFDERHHHVLFQDQGAPERNAWLLRQMTPAISATTGRLVLHASAVARDDAVVAFVGESGVGKTTLASYLSTDPTSHVADDLLPVRYLGEPRSPVLETLRPLRAVCFLERDGDRLDLSQLPRSSSLEMQIRNGFGEHGNSETWAFQFDAYHRLSASVPHYRLVIPDNLGALDSVAAAIGTTIFGRAG